MDNRENKCCKYRARKLALKALKKKNKADNKTLNKNENCQEEENFKSKGNKCTKKSDKKAVKVKFPFNSEMDDLLSRIKPSVAEREKYSKPEHVICFLEGMPNMNMQKKNSIYYTIAGSKSGKGEINKSKERKGKDDSKNCGERKKKVKSWCKSTKEEKPAKLMDIECDSICSFDSVVDLSGLAMTREEKKSIAKKRRLRKKVKQKGGKEEKEGAEAKTEDKDKDKEKENDQDQDKNKDEAQQEPVVNETLENDPNAEDPTP